MEVGDLVIRTYGSRTTRKNNPIGIITYLWPGDSDASVLFEDGEYDVDRDDLEVINESR
jgi:hypothetical protein